VSRIARDFGVREEYDGWPARQLEWNGWRSGSMRKVFMFSSNGSFLNKADGLPDVVC
jgi:hypothetical protein